MKESTILYRLQIIRDKKKELRKKTRIKITTYENKISQLSKKEIKLMEELGNKIKEEDEKEEKDEEIEERQVNCVDIDSMRDLKRRAQKGEISQFTIIEIQKKREEWIQRERENSRKEVKSYFDKRDRFVKKKKKH